MANRNEGRAEKPRFDWTSVSAVIEVSAEAHERTVAHCREVGWHNLADKLEGSP